MSNSEKRDSIETDKDFRMNTLPLSEFELATSFVFIVYLRSLRGLLKAIDVVVRMLFCILQSQRDFRQSEVLLETALL